MKTPRDNDEILRAMRDALGSATANIFAQRITSEILARQGKALRAAYCLEVGRAAGVGHAVLTRRAAIVELLHLASLLHDDVLDGATRRRGRGVPHETWGETNIVLWGDLAVSCALAEIARCDGRELRTRIADTLKLMCAKEIEHHLRIDDWTMSMSDYADIAQGKTGGLFAVAGLLGAPAGDSFSSMREAAAEAGLWLGTAYQYIDDLYDLLPASGETQKDTWRDLPQGLVTLPTILALRKRPEWVKLPPRAVAQPDWVGRLAEEGIIDEVCSAVDDALCKAEDRWSAVSETSCPLAASIRRQAADIRSQLPA